MGIIKFSFFFFIFLRLVPYLIEGAGAEKCPIYQWCTKDEPTVRFPFTLKGRGSEVCGSPGYELACDETNKTVLVLPFSGKFFVRNVYSFLQKIEIYDPDNCLPERIRKLNLSGTPYQLGEVGVSYQTYSLLNCTSSIESLLEITKKVTHIRCLSSSTHTVIATDLPTANIAPLNTSCVRFADVPIPNSAIKRGVPVDFNENYVLSWSWLELPPYLTYQKKSKNFLTSFHMSFTIIIHLQINLV
ncbi:hypothetical protein MKW98_017150 [Papaver atlanticum]|uniref:RING-type E3 ubiquitin transferase n=1 Tax=Papaver atlanticum TaxID=357466 RepID=A0AAD4SAR9_9MAGN|nr:hypothetical protein MKW98_017150 [Papaver atlanticum]